MLEVGVSNPAQQINETGRGQAPLGLFPHREGDAGQELVGVITGPGTGTGDGFVNGPYQRLVDRSLGADICQKHVLLTGLVLPQLIDKDEAGNGKLLGEPCLGDGTFRDQFLEPVIA